MRKRWVAFLSCTLLFTVLLLFWNVQLFSTVSPFNAFRRIPVYHHDMYRTTGLAFEDRLAVVNNRDITPPNLLFLVDELMRINHSVHGELIELDQRRRELLSVLSTILVRVERSRNVLFDHSRQFMRLQATVSAHEAYLKDLTIGPSFCRFWPRMDVRPSEVVDSSTESFVRQTCTMDACFNWEHCPLGGFLRICIGGFTSPASPHTLSLITAVRSSPHYAGSCETTLSTACLTVAFGTFGAMECLNSSNFHEYPSCLVIFSSPEEPVEFQNLITNLEKPARFMIAAPHFSTDFHRQNFDIVFSGYPELLIADGAVGTSDSQVSLIPGRRVHLLSFCSGHRLPYSHANHGTIVDQLQMLSNHSEGGLFRFQFHRTNAELLSCWSSQFLRTYSNRLQKEFGWIPCQHSLLLLRNSTFGLLLGPTRADSTSYGWQSQLLIALIAGAVPVVFGDPVFPLGEAISPAQWSRAVVHVPRRRIVELPVLLQSIPESHLVEMRRQGQLLFRRYFRNVDVRLASLLLAISRRLGFPQPPAPEWISHPGFRTDTFQPPQTYAISREDTMYTDLDDFLGPVGPVLNSERFISNFTHPGGTGRLSVISSIPDVDNLVNPFWSHPSIPWEPFLPSDAASSGSSLSSHGLRPINYSVGLAGFEFRMALGGMYPYEQFTIVLLTYDRFELVCKTLSSLLNIPYLHSIVVVWNHPNPPSQHSKWPQLHVPVKVVKSHNNSLNNRFLPYDIIKTDAVLSLDDDIQLRHDEIIFAFRVWREHRDQLVGFPPRSHRWNTTAQDWSYHYDYTCQFSIVLTGAAFIHKYYMFAYTWEMPYPIRHMVDEHMNCEDLSMNFLVAHLIRKSPIKATLHWSFDCATCKSSLHGRSQHYRTRSDCITWLTGFYGYNPLIYTQYRVDSLLFKTRLPANKQKCFKFV